MFPATSRQVETELEPLAENGPVQDTYLASVSLDQKGCLVV
jgi:hypothetical protein